MLSKMVTNSTGKSFNESTQLGLTESCESPNKENNRQNKAEVIVQGLEISSIMLKFFSRVQALSKTVNITTAPFTVRNKRLLYNIWYISIFLDRHNVMPVS